MKKLVLLCLGLLAVGPVVQAQISITTSSLTYTQNFDLLDTVGSAQTNMPAGWGFYEWGGTSANATYRAGNGSANTGDTYSFGIQASSDRALGSLASGGVPKFNYGAVFSNNTGLTISSFTLTFKEEQWRSGDTSSTNLDSVRFYYSTTASGINDSTFTNWTEVPALLMTSILPSSTSTSGNAQNGNVVSAIKTALVNLNLPTGINVMFRWYDFNSIGSDDALAIDSLTASFTVAGITSPRPSIIGLTPNNGSINVPQGANLLLTFNKSIQKGASGNFYIKNETDQTTLTKPVSSTDISASGNLVIIANTGLVFGKTYHVTFDSSAIDSGGYKSYGIYDTAYWRFTTAPPSYLRPVITGLNPADNATNVAPGTNLSITFNRNVQKGTGNITVYNVTDNTNLPVAVSSPDVAINGNLVTVSNVNLQLGKSYYVKFDSSAFDTAGYKSYGIYTDTAWNFSTQGPVQTVTSINEQFDNSCANASGLPAGWLQYSVTGSQTWRCSGATTAPNYYMTMNGGSGSPVVFTANEDWLLTPRLNLSTMFTPQMIFRNRFRFGGDNMHVLLSSDYNGTGDPNSATWTDLNVAYNIVADSNKWTDKSINLTAFKSNAFFIAFKYTSTSSSARQWDVDSVLTIDAPTGIRSISRGNNLPVVVIGQAGNGHVVIAYDLQKSASLRASLYDVSGREVYRSELRGEKGSNQVTLEPQALQSGLYLIRLSNGTEQGIARVLIQ